MQYEIPDALQFSYLSARFYQQNDTFLEWIRGDWNPWPPPCKVRVLSSPSFILVQEILQNNRFIYMVLRGCSPPVAWVGVLLVYKCSIKAHQLTHYE